MPRSPAPGSSRRGRTSGEAADLATPGRHVVIATGTASGKSLGYLAPVLTRPRGGCRRADRRGAPRRSTSSPTKALAADQLARIAGDGRARRAGGHLRRRHPAPRSGAGSATTPTLVLTNPDLLHHSLLPRHERWAPFLRALRYVVVDECHVYRGVFGSHLAAVLRRLRRVAARYGSHADLRPRLGHRVATPPPTPSRLIGMPVTAVTDDGSPRGGDDLRPVGAGRSVDGRQPALGDDRGGRPARRAGARRVQAVAFARSRAGVEALAAAPGGRARRGRAGAGRRRRGIPGRLPAPRSAASSSAALRDGSDRRAGGDQRPRAGHRHQRPRRRAAGRLARDAAPRLWQQAGRAGRSGTRSLARARRGRRPARHLPRAPPRGDLRPAGRGHRHGPGQPPRAGARTWRRRPPSCR